MQRALQAVERLQAKLKERGETPTREKLALLKTVLQSPLFHHIFTMQQTQLPLGTQVCVCQRHSAQYREDNKIELIMYSLSVYVNLSPPHQEHEKV